MNTYRQLVPHRNQGSTQESGFHTTSRQNSVTFRDTLSGTLRVEYCWNIFRVLVNKELLTRNVLNNRRLLTGTVLVNKFLLARTVPVNELLLARTAPVNKFLVRPQKCQSFVQRLRGPLFSEGNQLSVDSPL